MPTGTIEINRAPVLTLWAAVVAERLGFDEDEALSLGKALAGLNAQAKGRKLGIFQPNAETTEKVRRGEFGEEFYVDLLGRKVPARKTDDGVRSMNKDKTVDADSVRRYLYGRFGNGLEEATEAMRELAASFEPESLAERGFELYERFRPEVPKGRGGWAAKGELSLDRIRELAAR